MFSKGNNVKIVPSTLANRRGERRYLGGVI